MARLRQKVAFITGAASGIGRSSALQMARDGASLMCADLDESGAAQTAAMIQQEGGHAQSMGLDVSSGSDVEAALQQTAQQLGGVQVLFNNAGIAGADTSWDAIIAVNLTGVSHGLFYGAPFMADAGGGSIVNTASVAGLVGLVGPPPLPGEQALELRPSAGAYVASKHGVAGLTKQYAVAFGARGVRVNAIAPGYIETPMTAEARETPQGQAFLTGLHPMGRLGQPEEIAAVAAFLASDEASFINGVILPVDGGYTAR